MGIGGAPEGVLSAAALKCLGGEIQARFRGARTRRRSGRGAMGVDVDDIDRVYTTDDLASGQQRRLLRHRRDRWRAPARRPLLRRRRAHALADDELRRAASSASSTRSTCGTRATRRRSASSGVWTAGGELRYGDVNSWTRGLVGTPARPYLDLGANGGATRIVTGPDTGESTRLDTRPTTRLGGGNVPGTGVSAGPSAGLSTGSDTGTGCGSSSVGAVSLPPVSGDDPNRGDRRDPRDRGASAAPF